MMEIFLLGLLVGMVIVVIPVIAYQTWVYLRLLRENRQLREERARRDKEAMERLEAWSDDGYDDLKEWMLYRGEGKW